MAASPRPATQPASNQASSSGPVTATAIFCNRHACPIRVRVSADRRVMENRDGVADGWNWLRGAVARSAVEWRSIDDKRRRKVAIGQQGWSDTCYKVGRREGMSGRQGNEGKGAGLQQVLWSWWWSWLSAKGARELLGRSERSDAK